MGAVPKKKPSKTRQRHRHSAWRNNQQSANELSFIACEKCGALKLPHQACKECGFYRNQTILETKAKIKKVSS